MSKASDDLFANIGRATKARCERQAMGLREVPDSEAFPYLTALLSAAAETTGHSRTPGAVTIFPQNGRLVAVLKCPSMGSKCFVTLRGFQDALCDVEKALAGDSLEWTKDEPYNGNGRTK